ncbi:VanW family protein [Candidatus Berkelbacteria bacterium]|nr:VanW family protein [Candidatus Berkelbacteria bacterium]
MSKGQRSREKFWVIFSVAIVLLAASLAFFEFFFQNKVFARVYLGELNLGGKQRVQIIDLISPYLAVFEKETLVLKIDDRKYTLFFSDLNLKYDTAQTAEKIYQFGRSKSLPSAIKEQFYLILGRKKVSPVFDYDEEKLNKWLLDIKQKEEVAVRDATLTLNNGKVEVLAEREGRVLNDKKLLKEVVFKINHLDKREIVENTVLVLPKVRKENTLKAKALAKEFLSQEIILKTDNLKEELGHEIKEEWLEFVNERGELKFVINQEKIRSYIETLAKKIDRSTIDAKLKMEEGRVVIFQPSQDGLLLEREKAVSLIEKAIGDNGQEIILPVKVIKAPVRTETVNDFGVKESIGKATTSFKGSPQNRIHNIQVGTSFFNGLLIKPGETFSTLDVLGAVSSEQGFLPELVIKEDRLIPEVGGGLCQVSTTLFRAALNSGLEIIERQNHSFRVRYYEPPVGMDATIYSPRPDLKFKNNTLAYILIQAKTDETSITFDFFGAKDSRQIEITQPQVFNFKQPGDPIYIEDSTLPKGETKQIEKAVNGADAVFYYKVTLGGKIIEQKTFKSHYVPWKAKYKVGTKEETSSEPAPNGEPPQPTP